ncbi:MAG: SDR family NAD(P)-dependent oxidoreductase [Acidimicrobiales bacterium]
MRVGSRSIRGGAPAGGYGRRRTREGSHGTHRAGRPARAGRRGHRGGRPGSPPLAGAGPGRCRGGHRRADRATLERTAAELRGLGARAELFLADVRDPDAAERVIPALVARMGEVDVLVNNAGILGGLGPVATVEPDAFWDAFTVNVRGPFLWSRAVLPSMLGRGRGRIINVSSGSARQAVPNGGAYCASKAALSHLTAVLAAELTGSGVTTFAIAPMAATDMLHELVVSPRMPAPLRAVFAGIEQRARDPGGVVGAVPHRAERSARRAQRRPPRQPLPPRRAAPGLRETPPARSESPPNRCEQRPTYL